MLFCSQCGNRVGNADSYCANCGARQPAAIPPPPPPPAVTDPLANISPRTFSILCYVPLIGWLAAVVVLGARRFRTDLTLRFHAFQGLYIFAAWLLVDWAITPIFSGHHAGGVHPDELLKLIIFGIWVLMLIKTYQGESYSLPLLGELAHRSAHEKS